VAGFADVANHLLIFLQSFQTHLSPWSSGWEYPVIIPKCETQPLILLVLIRYPQFFHRANCGG